MIKGLVFLGDRRAEVREFPEERPGPGEVLLKMRASGMRGSDLNNYRADASQFRSTSKRVGHEPCGEVVELGGFEPPTSSLRTKWSPNLATAQTEIETQRYCRQRFLI